MLVLRARVSGVRSVALLLLLLLSCCCRHSRGEVDDLHRRGAPLRGTFFFCV
jgi:hypothetical protein